MTFSCNLLKKCQYINSAVRAMKSYITGQLSDFHSMQSFLVKPSSFIVTLHVTGILLLIFILQTYYDNKMLYNICIFLMIRCIVRNTNVYRHIWLFEISFLKVVVTIWFCFLVFIEIKQCDFRTVISQSDKGKAIIYWTVT